METDQQSRLEAVEKALTALAWGILAATHPISNAVVVVCAVCKHPKPQGHHADCPIGKLPGEEPQAQRPTLLVPRVG